MRIDTCIRCIPHKGHVGSIEKENNITVVYTKEAETADTYIEKATHELSRNYRVEVATSDRMEQIIIAGNGAARLSANEFRKQVDAAVAAMRDLMEEYALREKPSAKLAQGRIVGLDAPENNNHLQTKTRSLGSLFVLLSAKGTI